MGKFAGQEFGLVVAALAGAAGGGGDGDDYCPRNGIAEQHSHAPDHYPGSGLGASQFQLPDEIFAYFCIHSAGLDSVQAARFAAGWAGYRP